MEVFKVLREGLELGKVREEKFLGLNYFRFSEDFKGFARGTVVFKDFVIYGYPHIGRILYLKEGLREHFKGDFFVEEKVDGYNVRIFYHGGKVYALTRGGFLCPFTGDRVLDFIPLEFFKENPNLVLCAEVAGPENPYIEEHPPYVKEDVNFFVFDVMEKNKSSFLPYSEKLRLLKEYSLPSVEIYGRFSLKDYKLLKELLLRLEREGKEGVVFKEEGEEGKRAKYITSRANLNDIKVTSFNMLSLPPEYYTNRILRAVLFLEEEGLEGGYGEVSKELGKAFVEGLREAIELFKREGKVYRTFRCRFRREENAKAFLKRIRHLSKEVQIVERSLRKEGEFFILEFDKVYLKMTGLLGHLLRGGLVFD